MIKFVNNYIEPLTLAPGQSLVSLGLPNGEYRLTIADSQSNATRWEIVSAIVFGGVATLTRGTEGTTAQAWPNGSVIYNGITAKTLNDLMAQEGGGSLEMQATETHIQWRAGESAEWIDLLAIDDIAGLVAAVIAGQLVPAGGRTGQSLVKSSDYDYELEWANRLAPTVPRLLAVADSYGSALINLDTGMRDMDASFGGRGGIVFINNGTAMLSVSSDVTMYSLAPFEQINSFYDENYPSAIGYSDAGGFFIFGGVDLFAYDSATLEKIIPTDSFPQYIQRIVASPDGQYVAFSVNDDDPVVLFETTTWSRVALDASALALIIGDKEVSFNFDSSELLVASTDAITRFSVFSGSALAAPPVQPAGDAQAITFNQDYIFTVYSGDGVSAYGAGSLARAPDFPVVAGLQLSLAASPDGKHLVVCSDESPYLTIIFLDSWNTPVTISEPPTDPTLKPSFSSDGKVLAVGSLSSPVVYAYDTTTWELISGDYGLSGSAQAIAVNF